MTTQIEYWIFSYSNRKSIYKVYTEDKSIRNELIKINGCILGAIYTNSKFQDIGWDIVVPANKIEFIKNTFSSKYLKN